MKRISKPRWALAIASAVVLGGGPVITSTSVPEALAQPVPAGLTLAPQGTSAPTVANDEATLSKSCPANINVQVNWWPSSDDAFLFQLIGPNGKTNTSKNTYSGEIGTSGVTLTILPGGPAASYQTDTALTYENSSIYLTMESTDEQIANSAAHPTTAVFAWYQQYPLIFLWGDPAWNFKSLQQIAASNVKVLVFSSGTYVGVFEKEGLLKKSQVDTSYNGAPDQFVAADGKIVQQGFVDEEPYQLEHETPSWDKPIKFIIVPDSAYPVYQDNIAVRSSQLTADAPCLTKLVPLFQEASVQYAANPASTNKVVVDYTNALKGTGIAVSAGEANYAHATQLQYGLIANGTDGVYGSFDTARLQSAINKLGPVLASEGEKPEAGLTPADLGTNEFLDPSIKLAG